MFLPCMLYGYPQNFRICLYSGIQNLIFKFSCCIILISFVTKILEKLDRFQEPGVKSKTNAAKTDLGIDDADKLEREKDKNIKLKKRQTEL